MRLTCVLRAAEKAKEVKLYTIPLASGGAPYRESSQKIIRFVRQGCTNRPFFHISVQEAQEEPKGNIIEQLGTFDPLPNQHNEKLVAINFSRLQHWVLKGAIMSQPVQRLLGLAGYFPVHPRTFRQAWLRRKLLMETLAELEAAAAAASSSGKSQSEGEESASGSEESTTENESPK